MNDHEDNSPVGTMGKLRSKKILVWVTIVSLLILTLGGTIILFVLQAIGS
jgi:hypothetical protein